jgi:hypothetical protein
MFLLILIYIYWYHSRVVKHRDFRVFDLLSPFLLVKFVANI